MVSTAPAVLVHSIDITAAERGMRLTLKDLDGHVVAELELLRTPLRQWLSILQHQYCKAHWPLDVWPSWMQSGNLGTEATSNVLH